MIDYGPLGPAGDQISCKAQVDDVTLGAGSRADLNVTIQRVAGGDTTVLVGVLLINAAVPPDPATIDPPGTVIFGNISVGFKSGISLPANVATDVHFLVDNPSTGAAIANYSIFPIIAWPGNFVAPGPTPVANLTPA